MKSKAHLIDSIYSQVTASPAADYLGEFSQGLLAMTYETIDEEWSIPAEASWIVFSIEGSTGKPSESAVTLEDVIVKFFIGGNTSLEVADTLAGLFDGKELAGFIGTYLGTNTVPKSPQNLTAATVARFKFI